MEKSSINQQKPAEYKNLEDLRWHIFAKDCQAKLAKTCTVSQEYCSKDSCFATQIITYIKGFM